MAGVDEELAAAMCRAGLGRSCMGVFSADDDEMIEAANVIIVGLRERGIRVVRVDRERIPYSKVPKPGA